MKITYVGCRMFFIIFFICGSIWGKWESVMTAYSEDEILAVGVYGEPGIYDIYNTPGARSYGCYWSYKDSLFIYSGYGYAEKGHMGDLADLWQFNITMRQWRFIKGSRSINPEKTANETNTEFDKSNLPPARSFSVCFNIGDRLYFFGGKSVIKALRYKDLYEYNILTEEWREVPSWYQGYSYYWTEFQPAEFNKYRNYGPGSVTQSYGVVAEDRKVFFMTGGCIFNCDQDLNVVWRLDLDQSHDTYMMWAYFSGDQTSYYNYYNPPECSYFPKDDYLGKFGSKIRPNGHYGGKAWYSSGKLYFFVGAMNFAVKFMNSLYVTDIDNYLTGVVSGSHCLDYTTSTPSTSLLWGNLSSPDFNKYNMPSQRYYPHISRGYDRNSVIFYDGVNFNDETQKDIWIYSISRNMWKPYNFSNVEFNSKTTQQSTSTTIGGRVGGFFGQSMINDTETMRGVMSSVVYFSGLGENINRAILSLRDTWVEDSVFTECSGFGSISYTGENIFTHDNPSNVSTECICIDPPNYWGDNCEFWKCNDVFNNHSSVCSGNGTCIAHDSCECVDYRYGSNCESWKCFDILMDNSLVCSGNGTCSSHDTCECFGDNTGDECQISPFHYFDCSNNGIVINTSDIFFCNCSVGYYGETKIDKEFFTDCNFWTCNGKNNSDLQVCSRNGRCESYDMCVCNQSSRYFGRYCNELIEEESTLDFIRGTLTIQYTVPILELSNIDEIFDCELIFPNSKSIFGEKIKCQWYFTLTSTLKIVMSEFSIESYSSGSLLEIHPHTKTSESTYLSVLVIEKPKVQEEENKKNPSFFTVRNLLVYVLPIGTPLILLSVISVLIVLIILFCLCCCILLICFVIISVLSIAVYLFMKNRKWKDLKNVDDMLKEQLIETDDDGIGNIRFDRSLFAISFKEVVLSKRIGKGGSGAVIYSAAWKGMKVAFKVFKTKDLSRQANFDEFEKEVMLLSSLKHPNILVFYGCCLQEPRVGIVMEFCEHGDLFAYIEEKKRDYGHGFLNLKKKISILSQVADGMEYLHSKFVIHRDLKCMNVLLDEELNPKIIDFGLSKIRMDSSSGMTRQTGTSVYMAPEVTLGRNYDEKCDVFSFAIVMFEVMTENFDPYGDQTFPSLELKVANEPDFRPKFKNEDLYDLTRFIELMVQSWHNDPKERPSFDQLGDELRDISTYLD